MQTEVKYAHTPYYGDEGLRIYKSSTIKEGTEACQLTKDFEAVEGDIVVSRTAWKESDECELEIGDKLERQGEVEGGFPVFGSFSTLR